MGKYTNHLIILLFLIARGTSTFGQLYNFTNYTMEQGLPQSTVFCVMQDSHGFLWVGTESGAARFDGNAFTVFDRSKGLPGNTVRSIVEDNKGFIWFGTDRGIAIFDGVHWKTINSEQGLQGTAITKLLPDAQGRMWAATNDAGVNVISTQSDTFNIQNIGSMQGLSGDFVLDMIHDTDGTTWVAMIGGLSAITFSDEKAIVRDMGDSILLPSQYISCIDKDKDGNLWLGTLDAGAFLWKSNSSEFIPYGYSKGITDDRIWDIFCDDDGTVWFASEKSGIFRLNNHRVQNISSRNGLPGNQIFCIYRDSNRNLWLGSVGQGLSMFQGFHLVHYTSDDGIPGSQILAVKADSDGKLWMGSNQKGFGFATFDSDKIKSTTFVENKGFKTSDINSIDFDNKGRILAGTQGEGLLIYDKKQFHYLTVTEGLADNNINCVYSAPNGSIYVGTNNGFNEITEQKIHTISEDQGLINSEVQTVISDNDENIWMGTLGGLARFQAKTSVYRDFDEQEGLTDLGIHTLVSDKNNNLWLGTNNGIYNYNLISDTITAFAQAGLNSKTINSLLFFNDTTLIAGTSKGFNKITFDTTLHEVKKVVAYDKSNGFKWSETNYNAICSDAQNHIWFGTVNGLTCYKPELEDALTETPRVHLSGIRLSFEAVDWNGIGFKTNGWNNYPSQLSLKYNQNHMTFDFVGIYLRNPEKVEFRYKLEPFETTWSPSSKNLSVTYPGLSDNKYSFSIIASNDGVNWSEPLKYQFIIRPPFWKTIWFFVICIISLVGFLIFYIRRREEELKREKEHLEQVVKERTAEVVAQKDEIESQKEEITSSITYARRIQRAILPGIENLEKNTSDCFILFKPRDIVSGDFYWVERIDNQLIVAAADCTGHGVPGAFMSMLGLSFMNKIIKEQRIESPEIILEHMRQNVITSLKQGSYDGSSKDGMDMALCIINMDTLMMSFAGAYNPAIIISDGEVNELKADRMPVGHYIAMKDFTCVPVQLKKGDCIYMFSDGYQDQMGGPSGRKFMRKNLRELLLSIHEKNFCEQLDIMDQTIEDWRNHPQGKTDQMDDIVVIGFKV